MPKNSILLLALFDDEAPFLRPNQELKQISCYGLIPTKLTPAPSGETHFAQSVFEFTKVDAESFVLLPSNNSLN